VSFPELQLTSNNVMASMEMDFFVFMAFLAVVVKLLTVTIFQGI